MSKNEEPFLDKLNRRKAKVAGILSSDPFVRLDSLTKVDSTDKVDTQLLINHMSLSFAPTTREAGQAMQRQQGFGALIFCSLMILAAAEDTVRDAYKKAQTAIGDALISPPSTSFFCKALNIKATKGEWTDTTFEVLYPPPCPVARVTTTCPKSIGRPILQHSETATTTTMYVTAKDRHCGMKVKTREAKILGR